MVEPGFSKVMTATELLSMSRNQRTVGVGSISTRPFTIRTSCPSRGRISARCGPKVTGWV
jgi:hypothetical protein